MPFHVSLYRGGVNSSHCEYRWKKELKKIILYYMLFRGNDL